MALITVLVSATGAAPGVRAAIAADQRDAFRVCADPNNLPFSHRNGMGFENKLAELLAGDLGLPVEYTWMPQQMGFARNTLKAYVPELGRYKCDIIMGVSSGFEMGATTPPYYRSTYALVYRAGQGLDEVKNLDDLLTLPAEKRQALRIGVFSNTPPVNWLLKNGLIEQARSYRIQTGSRDEYPGKIIEDDLAQGKLDMAFVWGPIAGYFAKQLEDCQDCRHAHLVVVPLHSQPGLRYDFPISMAVRYGEKQWKAQIEKLLEQDKDKIRAILRDYNVPLLDDKGNVM